MSKPRIVPSSSRDAIRNGPLNRKSVRMVMDLRGYAGNDGVSRVKLIANAGDTTRMIDVFDAAAAKTGTPAAISSFSLGSLPTESFKNRERG